MKKKNEKKRLTFGEFVASVWEARGARNARRIVRHAVNTRLVVFPAHRRVVVS